eukprot:767804-Hanusia_phi.AAC.12
MLASLERKINYNVGSGEELRSTGLTSKSSSPFQIKASRFGVVPQRAVACAKPHPLVVHCPWRKAGTQTSVSQSGAATAAGQLTACPCTSRVSLGVGYDRKPSVALVRPSPARILLFTEVATIHKALKVHAFACPCPLLVRNLDTPVSQRSDGFTGEPLGTGSGCNFVQAFVSFSHPRTVKDQENAAEAKSEVPSFPPGSCHGRRFSGALPPATEFVPGTRT